MKKCPKCKSALTTINWHWVNPLHKCSNEHCKINNYWYRMDELKNMKGK